MAFKTDNQTLGDLGIFAGNQEESIYLIYNRCRTNGGLQLLEQMFKLPLSDAKLIANRVAAISFFQNSEMEFPYNTSFFAPAEFYLKNTDVRTQLSKEDNNLKRKMSGIIGGDTELSQIHNGIVAVLSFINTTEEFKAKYKNTAEAQTVLAHFSEMVEELRDVALKLKGKNKISYDDCVDLDALIRFRHHKTVMAMMNAIYYLDVYFSVAELSKKRGFKFAEVIHDKKGYVNMKGVYHPRLENGIGNDILIDETQNMIFLTGANMAGKSTIMKSIAIAIYVAHVGFPVAVESMQLSIRSGMFTTINLPDNINAGYSHFYSEVMRLKKVAQEVRQDNNLVIIFDELFRGTNVKDAYDATIEVVDAFSTIKECTFIVSTHIIEAGEVIAERCKNIQFLYMPTVMEGSVPRYTYKAKQGITADRHGMVIINNEKIIEIIETAFNN